MTEGKPKRSYWRRGPRKKKGAEDAAGTLPTTPGITEGGDPVPGSEAPVVPDTAEPFAPPPARDFGETGSDAAPAEAVAESAESGPTETDAGIASTGEVPVKGRRRSRRRGKRKPGDAPAAESAEGTGEAQAPAPAEEPRSSGDVGWGGQASSAGSPFQAPAEEPRPSGDVGWGGQASPTGGPSETPAAPDAGPPGTAAEPGGEPGEPGKRRRRRRRRRRGKGKGPAQGESGNATPTVSGDEEPEADDVGSLGRGRYGGRGSGRRNGGHERGGRGG